MKNSLAYMFLTVCFPLMTFASGIKNTDPKENPPASSSVQLQYFEGTVQTSSMDGTIPYGPAISSLVKRIVNPQDGIVIECTYQQNHMFYTEITKTDQPLVFTAKDSEGSFAGTLTFSDNTLSSWSYNIQVLKPNQGKMMGQLPNQGAVIDSAQGTMKIKKVWNNQVLISESYQAIDASKYNHRLSQSTQDSPTQIPAACR